MTSRMLLLSCALSWSGLAGCGGPQLSVTVVGGKGHVVAQSFTAGDGVDCLFCPQSHWDTVIDCNDTGGPACSGIAPAKASLSITVSPSPGFHLKSHDCPGVMPAADVSCTVSLMSCSVVCPSCTAAPSLDSANVAKTVCTGDTVHLTGTNLGSDQACVTINGFVARKVSGDVSSVAFTIDSDAPLGNVVTLETSKGKITTQLLTVTTDPQFDALLPNTGAAGSSVVITGKHLAGLTVKFVPWDETDGALALAATVTANTDVEATVTVPSGVQVGRKYVVTATNLCGETGAGGQHPFTAK